MELLIWTVIAALVGGAIGWTTGIMQVKLDMRREEARQRPLEKVLDAEQRLHDAQLELLESLNISYNTDHPVDR